MKRSELWIVVALVGLYCLAAWYLSPYRMDDAYITFRYVANVAEGHGYVYNPGEWVEGASNLLWAFVLLPFYWLPTSLPSAAAVLGGLLYAGLLGYLAVTLRDLTDVDNLTMGLSVALPLLAIPVGPLWSVSGLEASLYLLLLTVGLVSGSSISLLFAALTRPEGVAFLVVLPLLKESIQLRRYALALGGWVLVALGRLYVYGTPLPHSVTAKSGPVFDALFNGARYLQFGVVNHLGLIVTAGGVVGLFWLTDRYLTLRATAVVVLQVIVVLLAGGDWMPYSRLLLPLLPVFVLGWYGLTMKARKPVLVGMAVLVLLHVVGYPRVRAYTRHLTRSVNDNIQVMNTIESDLPGSVPRTMALADLGAFGWAARGWSVIDRVGLITPEIGNQGKGLYRNYSPEHVLSQRPTLIQTHLAGDAPVKQTSQSQGVQYLELEASVEELDQWATWPGGEALYTNERFRKNYRPYRVFRTPGNPVNVFWVRRSRVK